MMLVWVLQSLFQIESSLCVWLFLWRGLEVVVGGCRWRSCAGGRAVVIRRACGREGGREAQKEVLLQTVCPLKNKDEYLHLKKVNEGSVSDDRWNCWGPFDLRRPTNANAESKILARGVISQHSADFHSICINIYLISIFCRPEWAKCRIRKVALLDPGRPPRRYSLSMLELVNLQASL